MWSLSSRGEEGTLIALKRDEKEWEIERKTMLVLNWRAWARKQRDTHKQGCAELQRNDIQCDEEGKQHQRKSTRAMHESEGTMKRVTFFQTKHALKRHPMTRFVSQCTFASVASVHTVLDFRECRVKTNTTTMHLFCEPS